MIYLHHFTENLNKITTVFPHVVKKSDQILNYVPANNLLLSTEHEQ